MNERNKKIKFKENIYSFFTSQLYIQLYESEKSKLFKEELEEIFETNSLIPKSDIPIKIDDLIEIK